MKNTNRFDDKRILIWGYGREGKSTENWLKRDTNPALIDIFEGSREEIDEDSYDYIFKSPGIVLKGDYDEDKYTSQTEVFLEAYSRQTIGITGTKGKSTTSSMLAAVLSACSGRETILMGNIGLPCLDYYDEITDDTIVVFEMSCHQLKSTHISPHIAVFLNLYEDHLDYYGTMEAYFTAKSHVTLYQKPDDYYYHGDNVPHIATAAEIVEIDYRDTLNRAPYSLSIEGEHNQFNAEFVYRIATEQFACDSDEVRRVMHDFTGLAHRLQYVATVDGVRYLDDSISTIPEAAISAVTSIRDASTLLIGGMDRGIDYDKLVTFIREHSEFHYICMYASGKRIYDTEGISSLPYTCYVVDLKAAVKTAHELTASGAVILSPAAASYGYFKNFEERGDEYARLVREL